MCQQLYGCVQPRPAQKNGAFNEYSKWSTRWGLTTFSRDTNTNAPTDEAVQFLKMSRLSQWLGLFLILKYVPKQFGLPAVAALDNCDVRRVRPCLGYRVGVQPMILRSRLWNGSFVIAVQSRRTGECKQIQQKPNSSWKAYILHEPPNRNRTKNSGSLGFKLIPSHSSVSA